MGASAWGGAAAAGVGPRLASAWGGAAAAGVGPRLASAWGGAAVAGFGPRLASLLLLLTLWLRDLRRPLALGVVGTATHIHLSTSIAVSG
jgi:hypothetical protein